MSHLEVVDLPKPSLLAMPVEQVGFNLFDADPAVETTSPRTRLGRACRRRSLRHPTEGWRPVSRTCIGSPREASCLFPEQRGRRRVSPSVTARPVASRPHLLEEVLPG